MKIRCPNCMRISEIPHVEHGRIAVCSCQTSFRIDESTVTEEFSLPDQPPPEFIGRYRILRYIGRGASNCVYEGIDPETGVHAAIKTLLPEYAGDKPSRDQFLHAAKIYAKAVHPNIVKVFETGMDANGVPFLAMEFLSGGTLADHMQGNRLFSPKEAAEIGAAICSALTVISELGIVHRDIKPDNIMISEDGQYKLTDLGLAKLDPAAVSGNNVCVLDENRSEKTGRKTSFGTMEYMSPEQFIDAESCDVRSDIYSLGVTLYQLTAGRLPFEPKSRSELRRMHLSVEPIVPSTFRPDIPLDFDYIVLHCIQKTPEDRYRTPSELLADLEAFLSDRPLPSTTGGAVPLDPTPPDKPRPDAARTSALLPVAATIFVLLILCIAGLLFLMKRRTDSMQTPARDAAAQPVRESVPEDLGIDEPDKSKHSSPSAAEDPDSTNRKRNAARQEKKEFEKARTAAKQALREKTGFLNASEALEKFTSSDEYNVEAFELMNDLKKASDKAVDGLMQVLDEKAAPLIKAGDWDGAVGIYSDESDPLAPESKRSRDRKIAEIGRLRRKAAADAAKSDPVSPAGGTDIPDGLPDESPDGNPDAEEGNREL